ncbi:MAG: sulfotransferase, partial [Erythrobacter sp.]|nr:sulfotransferase [Erythrobacter sp.]
MGIPNRPHPLARARAADWAGRAVQALWDRGLTPKPPLEPEFLWEVGSRGFDPQDETSLRSAAEVEDFRARLDQLCASLREDAALNAMGHAMAYGQLTSAIRKRH